MNQFLRHNFIFFFAFLARLKKYLKKNEQKLDGILMTFIEQEPFYNVDY